MTPSNSMPAWLNALKATKTRCAVCRQPVAVRQQAPNAGIRFRDQWFCSPACFRSGAEQEINRLLQTRIEQPAHGERMPLGLSLLRQQLVSVEQLRAASEEHKETGEELGEVLVRQGAVSEKKLTAVRATLWGCPVFSLPNPPAPVAVRIPISLMRNYKLVPVHYVSRTNALLVGFQHSVEYGMLQAIEQITRCSSKPCFITPKDFHLQVAQQQNQLDPASESTLEIPQSPAEIAKAACSAALDIEADDAFVERCKEYLWVRLKSRTAIHDLLVRTE